MWKLLELIHKDTFIRFSFLFLTLILFAVVFYKALDQTVILETTIRQRYSQLQTDYRQVEADLTDVLYQKHLAELARKSLDETKQQIELEYQRLVSEESQEKLVVIDEIYSAYQATLAKVDRNKNIGLTSENIEETIRDWGVKFLDQQFDDLKKNIEVQNNALDEAYRQYIASLPTPTPLPPASVNVSSAEGYSYQTVTNERGSFATYLIKLPLDMVQVKTVTANSDNCADSCPTKSLADYVDENNAYAGIHGSYFCPPDYASCDGKVNSYDFAVYNTNLGKWLNEHALSWNDVGLATFNGNLANFYRDSKNYDNSAVTAGISNFPTLLADGEVVVDESKLTSYQKDVRGARGAIGVDGQNIYLAIITGATVTDAAYVMQSLGSQDALNLDGGGSSALYINGSYKVGPGRSLPNAILLIK